MGRSPIADIELSRIVICRRCKGRNKVGSVKCRRCGYSHLRPKKKDAKKGAK